MAEPKKGLAKLADDEIRSGPRGLLEELFEDYYKHRKRLYYMNFVRGIFFGFGTLIGGTLIVALLLWILSIFQYIPFLDGVVDAVQNSLQKK